MTAPIPNIPEFILCLSREGDSVSLNPRDAERNPAPSLPEQEQALACKTHQQVLAFLKNLESSETKNQISFSHYNNTCYDAHAGSWPKGRFHLCTLEEQIAFVQCKIVEADQGVRLSPRKIKLCAIQ